MEKKVWLYGLLVMSVIPQVESATFTVGPGLGFDYATLSEAVLESSSGDEILLASGTYNQTSGESFPISLQGGTTLRPLTPVARPTLSGGGTSQILRIDSRNGVSILGLYLTGGSADRGAGVSISNSMDCVIRDCTFEGNTGRAGVGVYSRNSSFSVIDSVFIENNSTPDGQTDCSAGIYASGGSIWVDRCCFKRNRVFGTFGSNSCSLIAEASATVTDCRFLGNYCVGWSAGIYCQGVARIERCLFADNTATGIGGALYARMGTSRIVDCQFYRNSAFRPFDSGGAIHIGEAFSRIERCLFVGNYSGWAASINQGGMAKTEIENCVFVGNFGTGTGGVSSRERSNSDISYSTFYDNVSLLRAGTLVVVEEGNATLHNCLAADTEGFDIVQEDLVSSATVEGCLFHNPSRGVYRAGDGAVLETVAEMDATIETSKGNREDNPLFPEPVNGNWDAPPLFSSENFQSSITDLDAEWETNQFAEGISTVKPNTGFSYHFPIISNTTNSITVWGDLTLVDLDNAEYEIHSVSFPANAPQVDAGGGTGPSLDFFGNARPFDVDLRGRDETGDEFDIGAIEVQYMSPFIEPRSDINRDGRVDSKDLILLYEAIESEDSK